VLIDDGLVYKGRLPKKAIGIVRDWCVQDRAELLDNWEKAQRFESLHRIQGADYD